jgi:hypothetical protein
VDLKVLVEGNMNVSKDESMEVGLGAAVVVVGSKVIVVVLVESVVGCTLEYLARNDMLYEKMSEVEQH